MRFEKLNDHFIGVGAKHLSAVDAERNKSNQHEIGPTKAMRDLFLGEQHQEHLQTIYIWLDDENAVSVESYTTHYDARLNHPTRSEWRLYYTSNVVTEAMREGDTLFLAKDKTGVLFFIVTPSETTTQRQLCWLFGVELPEKEGANFVAKSFSGLLDELNFASLYILEKIGIEAQFAETDEIDRVIAKFGNEFPRTAEFSLLARQAFPEELVFDDPDKALISWINYEEAMFRRLEKKVVAERLLQGFVNGAEVDVDGFVKYSLSVQNRRKSRMGHSLENHIGAILEAYKLPHERGAITENKQKPDFLFPGQTAYSAADNGSRLIMLGAKSSCKDRWRQVLAEAAKIERKHLLTLEPGISETQTAQMETSNLQLVVPASIHESYTLEQQKWLWDLRAFISFAGSVLQERKTDLLSLGL
ncbi:type II restriction endonuclease [Pseudovibrio denitrificans]|uniref:type II restriction endonuclease n=1 Tax=Pseudovibrio denitrificans TaxID=258256 RepID=UPI0039BF6071